MPTVEGAGVPLHYVEHGASEGPSVLLVHGAASDAAGWEPVAADLGGRGLRVVAYDRRGYGSSGAPEPYLATTPQEQGEDAARLARTLGLTPASWVGAGFGALVVLDVLVRQGALARGAVLLDAPVFGFVPAATEALAAERQALEDALRAGGPAGAVEAWLGAGADPAAVARARLAARGFFADYGGQATWLPTRAELRGVRVPVAVLTSPGAPPHVVEAAEALARWLPDVRLLRGEGVVEAVSALG